LIEFFSWQNFTWRLERTSDNFKRWR
jgi:hypothetical protein